MRAITAALGLPVPQVPPGNSWNMLATSLLSIRPGARYGVLEVGVSSPGWMGKYARMICPDVSVVTSIASEHHSSLGTFIDKRSEKAAMVRYLAKNGFAILNGDDPHVLWMAGETNARIITFGFRPENDIQAYDLETLWPHGNRFKVKVNGQTKIMETQLFGRHMVYPVLAAIAVGVALGQNVDLAAAGLANLSPTPGRLESIILENGAGILKDTFKSTLESIFSGLETLGSIPAVRRIAVLGDVEDSPGDSGPIHRKIGWLSAKTAGKILFICSNRSVRPFRAGAASAQMDGATVMYAGHDWFNAYQMLKNELVQGDVVLIKGRRTQRLDRLILALQGMEVGCRVSSCKSSIKTCDTCPMLKRGWDGLHVTV
jgi:UDP-N-acetylmuramyl pentapeptide synthase